MDEIEISEDTYIVLTRRGMLVSAMAALRTIMVLPKEQQDKIRSATRELQEVLEWLEEQTKVT